jgi:hypothetical protein
LHLLQREFRERIRRVDDHRERITCNHQLVELLGFLAFLAA